VESREPKPWRVKYDGECSRCGTALLRGEAAVWDRSSRSMHCVACPADEVSIEPAELGVGTGGASASREYERRMAKREVAARQKWGHRLGGFVLAATAPPATTRAWASGAEGEQKVAAFLGEIPGVRALHDRRVPRTKGNIDHLVIAPSGLFVIDAKNHRGVVRIRDRGRFFRTDERLYVGSRDCSELADGLAWQVEAVKVAVEHVGSTADVRPVLCFVRAEWPLFRAPSEFRGVRLESLRSLPTLLAAAGPLDREAIDRLARELSSGFPSK
jgi:hypothetical protein